MKRIDASESGIFEISWSPDGEWITYVRGEDEVCLANAHTGEIRVIGPGQHPGIAADKSVVIERGDHIMRISGSGKTVVSAPKDIAKNSPKRVPVVSPDGRYVVFVVCNVYDKRSETLNAYPYRHFLAVAELDGGKANMLDDQWYGGTVDWFPGSERFTHFEFDSTGGPQVHILSRDGRKEGVVSGLYPSISPDGKQIAARTKTGGAVAVYSTKTTWEDKNVEMRVSRFPAEGDEKRSANPPVWLDNRLILADEGGILWRIDTRRDKAEEHKKIALPSRRRKTSMTASPNRELLAMEVESAGVFELRVYSLI